jgi:hypothetical protein
MGLATAVNTFPHRCTGLETAVNTFLHRCMGKGRLGLLEKFQIASMAHALLSACPANRLLQAYPSQPQSICLPIRILKLKNLFGE